MHDEENYCTTGDKVVIRRCAPITSNKHYYVRNIVIPQPREDFYKNPNKDALMEELQYENFIISDKLEMNSSKKDQHHNENINYDYGEEYKSRDYNIFFISYDKQ